MHRMHCLKHRTRKTTRRREEKQQKLLLFSASCCSASSVVSFGFQATCDSTSVWWSRAPWNNRSKAIPNSLSLKQANILSKSCSDVTGSKDVLFDVHSVNVSMQLKMMFLKQRCNFDRLSRAENVYTLLFHTPFFTHFFFTRFFCLYWSVFKLLPCLHQQAVLRKSFSFQL